MSGEMIAILAVGVALAGLMLTSNRGLRQDMRQLEAQLRADMTQLRADMTQLRADMTKMEAQLRDDIKQLADRVGRLEYGQAKLEGLLEGLREAITGRTAAG